MKESDGIIKLDSHQMLNMIDEFCREVLELEPLTSKQAKENTCLMRTKPRVDWSSSDMTLT